MRLFTIGELAVVDREADAFADDRADAGGLVVERDGLADQLFVVRATQPRGHHPGSAVVDECEIREVEVEQLGELVEEQAGDLLLVVRIEQAVGESVDARELPVAKQ